MQATTESIPFVQNLHNDLQQPASSQHILSKPSTTHNLPSKVCNNDAGTDQQVIFSTVVDNNTLRNSDNAVFTGMSLSVIFASTNTSSLFVVNSDQHTQSLTVLTPGDVAAFPDTDIDRLLSKPSTVSNSTYSLRTCTVYFISLSYR